MAAQALDYGKVSIILVEAAIGDDKTVCDKYKISTRTLQRYRKLMVEDSHLASIVAEKKAAIEKDWLGAIAPALKSCIGYVQRVSSETKEKTPEMVHALAGAIKIIVDAELASKSMDLEIELSRNTEATYGPIAEIEKSSSNSSNKHAYN